MVFCYLKQYVCSGDLKLCTFSFDSLAKGKTDIALYINFAPEQGQKYLYLNFGIEGFSQQKIIDCGNVHTDIFNDSGINMHCFKSNDQQGYYWCAEISISKEFIKKHFNVSLGEKSIVTLNMVKNFENSTDYASLFPLPENEIFSAGSYLGEFIVLNY